MAKNTKPSVKPLGDRIFIKVSESEEKTAGGILLPDTAKEKPQVGEVVQVDAWDAEGHANVKYRGANWQVALAPGFPATPGAFTIAEVMGNRLIVKPN